MKVIKIDVFYNKKVTFSCIIIKDRFSGLKGEREAQVTGMSHNFSTKSPATSHSVPNTQTIISLIRIALILDYKYILLLK